LVRVSENVPAEIHDGFLNLPGYRKTNLLSRTEYGPGLPYGALQMTLPALLNKVMVDSGNFSLTPVALKTVVVLHSPAPAPERQISHGQRLRRKSKE